jgi:hypothetical protein
MMSLKAPLKILIDPVFTTKSIARCSSFYGDVRIVHDFCAKYPDTLVTCLVPADGGAFLDTHADLFQQFHLMENWNYIPVFCAWDRFQNIFFPSDESLYILAEFRGTHGDWDILLTNRNNGQYFRRASSIGRFCKFMCLYDTFPMFPFKKTFIAERGPHHNDRFSEMSSLLSYLAFDLVFVEAEFERREILSCAKAVLAPAQMRCLSEGLVAAYPGSLLPLDYVCSGEARANFIGKGELRVVYAQKLVETQRRFSLVYRSLQTLYSKLAATEFDISLRVCSNTSSGIPSYAKRDHKFILFESLPREKFWELLRSTHIQLSFSEEEDVPKGILEGILLGVIPVIPRRLWSRDLFGDDYVFFADTVTEAYAVISWIGKNREKAFDKFLRWYNDYFVQKVIPAGTLSKIFIDRIDAHFVQAVLLAQEKINNLAADLNREVLAGETIDLSHLPSKYADAVYDIKSADLSKVPFGRLPKRWRAFFTLRQVFGWQPTKHSWELTCPVK